MMIGSLGVLSFTSPWMLLGLAAIPVIWWLLRLTPPRPETVAFPPARLLLGLKAKDRTPIRSPWWLTALRVAVAAALIFALSGPVLKPPSGAAAAMSKPLLVVIDNGWASASRWSARRAMAEQLASAAEEAGQPLYLAETAGSPAPIRPLSPPEFHQRLALLSPQPTPGDRGAAAKEIEQALSVERGKLRVVWLADGVEDSGADALRHALTSLARDDKIEAITDAAGGGPLAIYSPEIGAGRVIRARILKAEPVRRSGVVAALTQRGERLAAVPFEIGPQEASTEVSIDLPLDIRNQVARLEIAGEASAGAVFLLDGRSKRRRVGLIASEGAQEAQPLLSSTHYLEKALAPFADVVPAQTANLDKATEDLVAKSPSAIILSDVGKLAGAPLERLRTFVEKGGMLIRFAGPRLMQGGDSMLPAPLLEGGRTLGGALTWTTPQAPAPFEQGSPFQGLAIPPDVNVSRQVLADPARMPPDTCVWARLTDGTPLVTAARRGRGQVVFLHITANPDWSNLPMSGLFVEMMRKIVEASPVEVAKGGQTAPSKDEALEGPARNVFLKPWRLLDGFGKLSEPGEKAQAIAYSKFQSGRAEPGVPAGLYGPQNATRALNVMSGADRLTLLKLPEGVRRNVYTEAKTLEMSPWLFLSALLLFMADGVLSAAFLGRGAAPLRKGTIAALVLGCLFLGSLPSARAEPSRDSSLDDATRFALQASLETRLAYILTGDAEADRVSHAGLSGLSKILNARTAVEPGEPMGIDPSRDELAFFPLIYWPVLPDAAPLPDSVLAKIDAYMKQGGLIVFDTKTDEALAGRQRNGNGGTPLSRLLGKLDLPPLQRVPEDHVLTKSFYLLQSFPGRWDNGDLWVEASSDSGGAGVKTDGVSSVIITSNDLAAAWALDDSGRPMFAVTPGGEEQREMSYRAGVNIVMYALTGNYKADQVHVPAILERLGH